MTIAFSATLTAGAGGSAYGKLAYGKGQYSRAPTDDLAGDLAPSIAFALALTSGPQPALAGDLAPSITLAGALNADEIVAGGFSLSVSLAGDLTITAATALAGDLAPSVVLAGDLVLAAPVDLAGNLTPTLTFAADMDVSSGDVSPPWTPDIVAGLEIWLDAAQMAFADGATVSAWPNLGSGSAPTIAGATPLTFKADVVNGHGAVRFSGASGGPYVRGVTTVTKDFTVAYVARRWGPIVGRMFMGPTPPVNAAIGSHGVGRNSCYDGGWLTFGTPWEAADSIPPEFSLFSYDSAAVSGSRFFVYGSVAGTNASNEGLSNTYGLSGYEATSPSELMDCDIGEVLVYDHQLTDADRQSCEGYLAWKWGVEAFLPADHPYYDAPPTGPVIVTTDLTGDLTPAITLSASLGVVFGVAGDLAPAVRLGGDLTVAPPIALTGDLAPSVTFAADMGVDAVLAGDMAPQIDLGATLTGDVQILGDLPFQIDFAASTLVSGPLWSFSTPCPTPPWTPTEPCPPSLWTPVDPCDVEWEDTESCCNG